jgi:hypothetical protein
VIEGVQQAMTNDAIVSAKKRGNTITKTGTLFTLFLSAIFFLCSTRVALFCSHIMRTPIEYAEYVPLIENAMKYTHINIIIQ